jgi:hypothetical protein
MFTPCALVWNSKDDRFYFMGVNIKTNHTLITGVRN